MSGGHTLYIGYPSQSPLLKMRGVVVGSCECREWLVEESEARDGETVAASYIRKQHETHVLMGPAVERQWRALTSAADAESGAR